MVEWLMNYLNLYFSYKYWLLHDLYTLLNIHWFNWYIYPLIDTFIRNFKWKKKYLFKCILFNVTLLVDSCFNIMKLMHQNRLICAFDIHVISRSKWVNVKVGQFMLKHIFVEIRQFILLHVKVNVFN